MRQMQSGSGRRWASKSRAKLLNENKDKVTFKTWGIDEAKAELEEIVEFLKILQNFKDWGEKFQKEHF